MYMTAHLLLNPVPTLKNESPFSPTTSLGLASKFTLEQKQFLKNECVFFLPPVFFNVLTLPLTYRPNSTLALQKKETEKQRREEFSTQI